MTATAARLIDMVNALSTSLDLISPSLVDHQKRVAYIAKCLAREMQVAPESEVTVVLAAALHDIGATSLIEKVACFSPEMEKIPRHAELGYHLLGSFEPLLPTAAIVRHHHVPWLGCEGRVASVESHIVHLADRIECRLNRKRDSFEQVAGILRSIEEHTGGAFMPEVAKAFRRVARRESFWLDLESAEIDRFLAAADDPAWASLGAGELLDLAKFFARIIDSRSPFTATHSAGVAAVAELLAREMNFSDKDCLQIRIAGLLHDLGKLAVPKEILEKPGLLNPSESARVRRHTYYTHRVLERVPGLETINCWASHHHERLDGGGYPFHIEGRDLQLGARILAVADVFSALSEDRPYRSALDADAIVALLAAAGETDHLDAQIVALARAKYERLDAARLDASRASLKESERFWEASNRPPEPFASSATA